MFIRDTDHNGPLTWMGGFPVYVSTVIAGVHGVALILSALAMAAGSEMLLQTLGFSSMAVGQQGFVWQLFTYAFIHTPPYWMFLIELYLLVVFGREVESHLGRAAFIQLYASLVLAPTVVLTALGWAGWNTVTSGSSALHFGVFVAFALIYPTAEVFFSIQARWVALALLAINSLQCLALSSYDALAVLAVDCVTACLFVGWRLGRFDRPSAPLKRPPVSSTRRQEKRTPVDDNPLDAVDPILEKISRHGMGSLTARERERLESARSRLLAQDRD